MATSINYLKVKMYYLPLICITIRSIASSIEWRHGTCNLLMSEANEFTLQGQSFGTKHYLIEVKTKKLWFFLLFLVIAFQIWACAGYRTWIMTMKKLKLDCQSKSKKKSCVFSSRCLLLRFYNQKLRWMAHCMAWGLIWC